MLEDSGVITGEIAGQDDDVWTKVGHPAKVART
jgi:hypothetical protein